ncbi:hypothetical protein H312_02911 [Anncaliia algerae PRA339]|uniref:Uncharacterized protein n=1 Tax=Anncaliia algerae PRA339 TaxID=1288291 RepID=A0A059EXE0_9MICR|nr:hypothetical protein H312_02911 [Anncaliia algerae PRA339]
MYSIDIVLIVSNRYVLIVFKRYCFNCYELLKDRLAMRIKIFPKKGKIKISKQNLKEQETAHLIYKIKTLNLNLKEEKNNQMKMIPTLIILIIPLAILEIMTMKNALEKTLVESLKILAIKKGILQRKRILL